MTYFITISMPWIMGWIYGRNDVDPNTEQGRKYYEDV